MTKRQPKGTPVGGQFAQDRKPDGPDLKVLNQDQAFDLLRSMGCHDDGVYRFIQDVGDRDCYERNEIDGWFLFSHNPHSPRLEPEVRVGPGGIREWYKNDEFVPPPVGTEINVAEARALPGYVEVMARFDTTGDRRP